MARRQEAEAIYLVAQRLRDETLVSGESLLFRGERVWSPEALDDIASAILDTPDYGERSFFEKLHDQLADSSSAVMKVAADLNLIYHLFPSNIGAEAKIRNVNEIGKWATPDFIIAPEIEAALHERIGSPGMHYLVGRPYQWAFNARCLAELMRRRPAPITADLLKAVANAARESVRESGEARNIILHLLFPNEFERIASDNHKKRIVAKFPDLAGSAGDVDQALASIRSSLEEVAGEPIDFYEGDLHAKWNPKAPADPAMRRYWWVNQGRTYELEFRGGYVWAPKAKNGRQLQHWTNVSELRVGDVVFHYANSHIRALGTVTAEPFFAPIPGELPKELWEEEGRKCWVAYEPLREPIHLDRIPIEWRRGARGPFDRDGGINQGYMYPLATELAERIMERFAAEFVEGPDPVEPHPNPMLVAATGPALKWGEDLAVLQAKLAEAGEVAAWYSYPLQEDHVNALIESEWIYLYASAPTSQLSHRFHVINFETQAGLNGIPSPWDHATPTDQLGLTRAGDDNSQIFKTWLLVDRIEELKPHLAPESLERADGQALVVSALLNGFGLWRLKEEHLVVGHTSLDELIQRTHMDAQDIEELLEIVLDKKQVILEGPPGAGKTYVADLVARHLTANRYDGDTTEQIETVQFHQSYGYEDFIRGIRPETLDGVLGYFVRDGVFKRFCERARSRQADRFVFVIDEINRGNIARIFGELLLLLEYRDRSATLPYGTEGELPFSIPPNVYVLGTMNTTDRSLAQIDYALRRRFYFFRLMPTSGDTAPVLQRWCQAQGMSKADEERVLSVFLRINQRLRSELGEHFQVGHSYFMRDDIAKSSGMEKVHRRAILPLLEEYYYNRRDRDVVLKEYSMAKLLSAVGGAEGDV